MRTCRNTKLAMVFDMILTPCSLLTTSPPHKKLHSTKKPTKDYKVFSTFSYLPWSFTDLAIAFQEFQGLQNKQPSVLDPKQQGHLSAQWGKAQKKWFGSKNGIH